LCVIHFICFLFGDKNIGFGFQIKRFSPSEIHLKGESHLAAT